MYYVGCFYSDGSEVLGTGDGQGFYEYKRLSTVVKKLRDNYICKNEKFERISRITYKIWEITEAEKFKDFKNYKNPILVL